MMLRQGGVLVATGLLVALRLALALSRLMRTMLVGVAPVDPLVFGASAVPLAGAAFVAILLPARRAGKVNPMTTLGAE